MTAIGIGIGTGFGGVAFAPTSYSNLGGTGNRTAIITVSTNIPLDPGGNDLTKSIDGSFAASSAGSWGWLNTYGALHGTEYLRFDFGASNAKRITEIKHTMDRPSAEGTWRAQASNDNFVSQIITISADTSITQQVTLFDCSSNFGFFRYYQLLGMSGSIDFTPWYQEVEFKL